MSPIKHLFVLAFENRSFDNLFGFSGLSGQDAEDLARTTPVDGLRGDETNEFDGTAHRVSNDAPFVMPADPGHEFGNVLEQLCGPGVRFAAPYPPVVRKGFIDSYMRKPGPQSQPSDVMRCFDTARALPVLHTLAKEFAICDRWFAAMPGPTWPNRMFFHAASSGGLDHSPTTAEIVEWETLDGFVFPNGHVFDALRGKGVPYRLYSGDEFPMVSALKGIALTDVHRIEALVEDLKKPDFPYRYVFLEPSYDVLNEYRHGDSMHPVGDVRAGESLLKRVYEALRASPIWESSALVVVWDEHGGFYDHVDPPTAVAPGDTRPGAKYDQSGFTFERTGVRVPALVISPFVPRNVVDHRSYDHSSIPSTVEQLFGLSPLTERDAAARHLLSLFSLLAPRDTPKTLPDPVGGVVHGATTESVSRPADSVNADNLPSVLHAAVRQHILLAPEQKAEVLARVASLATRDDVAKYLREVRALATIAGKAAPSIAARVLRSPSAMPSGRVDLVVVDQQPKSPGWRGRLARSWRSAFDWLRGPAVQALLFGVWAIVLVLVGARLFYEQEHMAMEASLARGTKGPPESALREITIVTVLFIVMVALPKIFMFVGALIVSRRVQQRRLAIAPMFQNFAIDIVGEPPGSPRVKALLAQTEQNWANEHEMLSNIYVDRFVQHAGIYGFLTSVSLVLGGMTVMSRAIQGWVLEANRHSETSVTECISVSLVVAVIVTFARDFGRFLVRTASRDASAQMLAWSTRRLLAMLIFSGLVGALAVKTDQFFKGNGGDSLGNLWVAGVLGGLVAFFGERAANALADRVGVMFGLPKRKQPDVDLTDLDDMADDDVDRLAEEGINSVKALADASAARLFYNTKYTLERICDWQDEALLLRCVGSQRARAFREQLNAPGATAARLVAVSLLASRRKDDQGAFIYTPEWDDARKLLGFATDAQATFVFERIASDDQVLRLVIERWAVSARIQEANGHVEGDATPAS